MCYKGFFFFSKLKLLQIGGATAPPLRTPMVWQYLLRIDILVTETGTALQGTSGGLKPHRIYLVTLSIVGILYFIQML